MTIARPVRRPRPRIEHGPHRVARDEVALEARVHLTLRFVRDPQSRRSRHAARTRLHVLHERADGPRDLLYREPLLHARGDPGREDVRGCERGQPLKLLYPTGRVHHAVDGVRVESRQDGSDDEPRFRGDVFEKAVAAEKVKSGAQGKCGCEVIRGPGGRVAVELGQILRNDLSGNGELVERPPSGREDIAPRTAGFHDVEQVEPHAADDGLGPVGGGVGTGEQAFLVSRDVGDGVWHVKQYDRGRRRRATGSNSRASAKLATKARRTRHDSSTLALPAGFGEAVYRLPVQRFGRR
jgi:hypothetical protein